MPPLVVWSRLAHHGSLAHLDPLCVALGYHTAPLRGSQTQTVSCFVPWSFYRELPESAGWSGLHLPLLTLIVVVQSLRMAITWPIPGAFLPLKARHGASAFRLVFRKVCSALLPVHATCGPVFSMCASPFSAANFALV